MTTAIATEVAKRRRQPASTIDDHIGRSLAALLDDVRRPSWPSPKYRDNPVGFSREALGVEPWSRQAEILDAVRDNARVAVSSGHKVSKSCTAAIIALWFFCSFDDARVVMSSTTSRQVDEILWRELRMRYGRSKVVLNEEPPYQLARSGLRSKDFREIVGFTAREAEAVAGISGKNLLYLVDEASGVDDVIFDAIEGNRAGGARLAMFSNPTRTEGEFFEAFHSKSRFYKTIQISSEESPNVKAGRDIVPGLATRAWVEEKREEWGEDSALFQVRVRGRFVTNESGKIISLNLISKAETAWHTTAAEGVLHIGLDPAGEGGTGDESAFAMKRGSKLIEIRTKRGLSDEAHATEILMLLHEFAQPRERVVVKCDVDGVGYNVAQKLVPLDDKKLITLVRVKGSTKLPRPPYATIRDALYANLRDWLKKGGGIPEDTKLERELHAPEWIDIPGSGRQKITPKEELRKMLGRSPDRADCVALSVWEPAWLATEAGGGVDDDESGGASASIAADEHDELGPHADQIFDPYGGAS